MPALPFRHAQQLAIAADVVPARFRHCVPGVLRGIMQPRDMNQPLPQQFQRGPAAAWKNQQPKTRSPRVFRRQQTRRRIATCHHQRRLRRSNPLHATRPPLPDAVVRGWIQIHRFDRDRASGAVRFPLPNSGWIRRVASRPSLSLATLELPPRANNSSTEHSNTAASASAVATDGERRSPFDGADRRARNAGAFRQFRLRPLPREPPRLHRVGCQVYVSDGHYRVAPGQIKTPRTPTPFATAMPS